VKLGEKRFGFTTEAPFVFWKSRRNLVVVEYDT
jgi:hypothetical protein